MRLSKKLLPPCATLLHINILKPLTACMFTHLCLATTMLGGDLCGDSCLPDLLEVNGHHYMVQSLRPLFLEIDTRSGQKLEKTLLSSKVVTPTTSGNQSQVWAKTETKLLFSKVVTPMLSESEQGVPHFWYTEAEQNAPPTMCNSPPHKHS